MNASPTTNPTALINAAIDLGLDITEAPVGAGFVVVTGPAELVVEWFNECPAQLGMIIPSHRSGHMIAGRYVKF